MQKHKITNVVANINPHFGQGDCSVCGQNVPVVKSLMFGAHRWTCQQSAGIMIHRKEKAHKKLAISERGKFIAPYRGQEWSRRVRARARGHCEFCKTRRPLEAHHMIRRNELVLRNDLANGVALCHECHVKFHGQPEFKNAVWEWFKNHRAVDAGYIYGLENGKYERRG